jgi:hypothetical protein
MTRFPTAYKCEKYGRTMTAGDKTDYSVMVASAVNIAGLLRNLFGVILLFRYGMPYRVRTGGNQFRWLSGSVDERTVRAERLYERLGILGLVLIVFGTAAQIGATFLP